MKSSLLNNEQIYSYLNKQVPVMMALSLGPGLGYIALSWFHDIALPAIIWYFFIVLISAWGYRVYRQYLDHEMSNLRLIRWYKELSLLFYAFFGLWTVIFLLYVTKDQYKLHYIAVFTQIGASVVASILLSPDKKLYKPTILILMVPLAIYFFMLGEWYSYLLSIFSCVLTWVLFYASNSSHNLLLQATYQALHDSLTGLYNRHFIIRHLQLMMNSIKTTNKSSFLLLIDLDHFKTINDTLGHDIGDRLLQEVSQRLQNNITSENTVARLGGDEFIITGAMFNDTENCEHQSIQLSNRISEALKQTYMIDKHHLYISSSIGVSLINSSCDDANRYIKEADIALYEVKAKGRDGVYLFNDEMSQRVENHLDIERHLHFALDNREIFLNYQPQYNKDNRVIGAEVLVRWNNQELGSISPAEFIPIAEQTGIIIELGHYIIKSAFITLQSWHEKGIELEQFSINISMRQFYHHNFVSNVLHLAENHLDKSLLNKVIFEMTETIDAEDLNKVISIMEEINQHGIRFSIDDFGTGYSSLSYLKKLPVNEIKLDRSFVQELDKNESDKSMIISILHMSKLFGLSFVAEGIETQKQLEFLREQDCDVYQGFYLSKPLSNDEFEALYNQK